jgi:Tol biopolymer transport system component
VRLGAAAALAIAAVIGPGTAYAGFPGENGRIAISAEWQCDGSFIHTVRPNGSDLRALSACNDYDRSGVWSADGQTILFKTRLDPPGGNEALMTMRHDGSDRQVIPVPEGDNPYPSPSGDRFVYQRFDPVAQRGEIWMANFDGSGLMRLGSGGRPRFSPDGTTIAFVKRSGLWLMDLDGTIIRRITRGRIQDLDWSPTGRRLAYTKSLHSDSIESKSDLFTIGVHGQDRRRLTHSEHKYESTPAWSPDGRWIAFERILRNPKTREIRKKLARGGKRSEVVIVPPRFIERANGSLYPTTLSWQPRP